MAPNLLPLTVRGHELPVAAPESAVLSMASDASDTNYIIIQTRASLTSREKEDLNQNQVQILELLDLNTYLCRYLPQDLQVLRQKPYINHVDVYHPHFKIHADIQRHTPALRISPAFLLSTESATESSSSNADEEIHISIGLHHSDEPIGSQTLDKLVEKQLVDPSRTTIYGDRIDTVVPSSSIPSLLKIDTIRVIEPTSTVELRNDHARNVLAADVILNDEIFTGTGQTIAIGDTGFDRGVTASTDNLKLHPAFTGRVHKIYNAANPDSTNPDDIKDTMGHGTHCAGSAVGADILDIKGDPSVRLRGTAPGARLIAAKIFDENESTMRWRNGNLGSVLDVPYEAGARIFSESWGTTFDTSKGQQVYDLDSEAIDNFVDKNPKALVCWAAGNDGNKQSDPQIDCQAVAKNILVIGNCYSSRPTKLVGPDDPDPQSGDHFQVSENSTYGPPKGVNRIKPDVVAPGMNIVSTCSGALQPSDKPRYVDDRYFYASGTSMSTPLVAGCVAVLREALARVCEVDQPSAALLKALIVNGAVPMDKNRSVFDPNFKWGFGRVNLAASIAHLDTPNLTKKNLFGFKEQNVTVREKDPYLFAELEVPTAPFHDDPLANAKNSVSQRRLRVTLAWADFRGTMLQRKLHLSVESEDQNRSNKIIRFGNKKDELDKEPDKVNNVQKVDWVNIQPGRVRILVHYEALETETGAKDVDAAVAWFLD